MGTCFSFSVSFLLSGGTALNFSVAVDFTASNGDPRKPNSLHYRSPSGQNQYTMAIRTVGEIIQDYDADKRFPAFGFGGKIPPRGEVCNNFFMNMRTDNPHVNGVEGILQAYEAALQSVTLHGPTNFSPVIRNVAKLANAHQDGRHYFVLLIITDGLITDFKETKQAIIRASKLPMSIIIIGAGNENFKGMEALDSDKGLLKSDGQVASRDIVQFVELRRFVSLRSGTWNREALADQVLFEIPKQLTDWMKMRGIKPLRE